MKKIISVFLSLALAIGASTFAFAADNDANGATQAVTSEKQTLTPEQQQARDAYLKVHYDLLNQLVALRQQTKDAVAANNTAIKQIKDKVNLTAGQNKDGISELKDLAAQRKALTEQAKQLQKQRLDLRSQYKAAVKARDLEKMKSIEQQILDLNSQIQELKAKDASIKEQVAPLKDQIKALKASNKQLKASVKGQLQQAKEIHAAIKAQEQEKAQLWSTYKQNIKDKDYAAAEATFQQIIEKKAAILDNIKQVGSILNQILASLN